MFPRTIHFQAMVEEVLEWIDVPHVNERMVGAEPEFRIHPNF